MLHEVASSREKQSNPGVGLLLAAMIPATTSGNNTPEVRLLGHTTDMDESVIRQEVIKLLREGQAHVTLERALKDLSLDNAPRRPHGLKSSWEILEHMRITQRDILAYMRDPAHPSPPWPEGYWRDVPEDFGDKVWQETLEGFLADRDALIELAETVNLTEVLPGTPGHTPLRQLFIAADHNAHHLGQIIDVRRLLNDW